MPAQTEPDRSAQPADGGKRRDDESDSANGGIRREPGLAEHKEVVPLKTASSPEFMFPDEADDDVTAGTNELRRRMSSLARQASLDPADDPGL